MNKTLVWVVVLLIILGGGYWFIQQSGMQGAMTENDMGTYAYTCENGAQFTMSPASDVKTIKLSAGSQGMFTGDVTLEQKESAAGARFEGNVGGSAVVFVGAGEEVQFSVGKENTVCNPVPNAEMAPWNWGDAGEGGAMKPDVRLVVGESIMGKWQSTEDTKFVREFKAFS